MEKRILGLDPGLATLGFGAIIYQESDIRSRQASATVSLVDFGTIQTPAKQDIGLRLCTIYEDLHSLLEQVQPHLVAIEKLFFYRMANTITVAQARGVTLLVMAQYGVPLVEFTPAQIKQALTGKGNADKYEVQQAVAREFNLAKIPKPDDAADALAVALTALYAL